MKKLFITPALLLFFGISFAQNNQLLSAFTDSYAFERNLEYKKAARMLEKVYDSHRGNYEINFRLGWLTYASGDYSDAETYYKRAIELKPLSLEAIYGLMLPLIAQQRYNSVINYARKALVIAPNDSRAEYYLGLAYYYQKDYAKSEKFLEKAINKYPFDLDINLMLGWTKLALGKKNEAKSLFLVARRNSPYNSRVKVAMSVINK